MDNNDLQRVQSYRRPQHKSKSTSSESKSTDVSTITLTTSSDENSKNSHDDKITNNDLSVQLQVSDTDDLNSESLHKNNKREIENARTKYEIAKKEADDASKKLARLKEDTSVCLCCPIVSKQQIREAERNFEEKHAELDIALDELSFQSHSLSGSNLSVSVTVSLMSQSSTSVDSNEMTDKHKSPIRIQK